MSDTAKIELLRGSEFPHDGNHADSDWATIAARGVLHNLNDRRGIKWELAKVDDDIRAEIVETMADIIRAAYDLESLDRIAAFHEQVKSIDKEKWQKLSLDLWEIELPTAGDHE